MNMCSTDYSDILVHEETGTTDGKGKGENKRGLKESRKRVQKSSIKYNSSPVIHSKTVISSLEWKFNKRHPLQRFPCAFATPELDPVFTSNCFHIFKQREANHDIKKALIKCWKKSLSPFQLLNHGIMKSSEANKNKLFPLLVHLLCYPHHHLQTSATTNELFLRASRLTL